MIPEIEYLVGIGHYDESTVGEVRRDALLLKKRCSRLSGAIQEPRREYRSLVEWAYIFQEERRARKFAWYAGSLETVKTVMLRKLKYPSEKTRETDSSGRDEGQ